MKDDVVIVSAVRTPVGAFNGVFATLPATNSVRPRSRRRSTAPALRRHGCRGHPGTDPDRRAGPEPGPPGRDRGRRPGRNPGLGCQPAVWLGLRSVALGYQAILNGDSEIVVAGGQESMSVAPHCAYLRSGVKMGNFDMIDTMIKDGLWDAFNGYHMGNTRRTSRGSGRSPVSSKTNSRSSRKTKPRRRRSRQIQGRDRTVTIKSRKGDVVVDTDEYPKHGTTLESIGKLRPAFDKDGTVTAGNASGINDGAALWF